MPILASCPSPPATLSSSASSASPAPGCPSPSLIRPSSLLSPPFSLPFSYSLLPHRPSPSQEPKPSLLHFPYASLRTAHQDAVLNGSKNVCGSFRRCPQTAAPLRCLVNRSRGEIPVSGTLPLPYLNLGQPLPFSALCRNPPYTMGCTS